MKHLLTMIAIGTLTANIATPLINQSSINNKTTQETMQSKSFSFYENDKEFEFNNNYSYNASNTSFSFMFTYNITNIKITDYQSFSAIDQNNTSYTKTSWGNEAYWGIPFKNIQNISLSSMIHLGKVENKPNEIAKYSNITLFDQYAKSGLAELWTHHRFGLSYYYSEVGEVFLQFFGVQLVTTGLSMSGGSLWTNYGIGFRLN